jgi:hypothetical protein
LKYSPSIFDTDYSKFNIELVTRQNAIDNFMQGLSRFFYDIKAEALINQALQKAMHPDDFVVLNDGRFFREYRNDLYAVDQVDDAWLHQLLQLHLSRSGLYDLVPEGLFHQSYTDGKSVNTAADMAAHSRRDRKKEMAARKFFQPVENSFFRQRVQMESEEERLIAGIDNGLLNDYFYEFWEFPAGLNKTSAMLLVLLLPYAYTIAGDLQLMQDCLEILLQEKVSVTSIAPGESFAPGGANGLGMGELGNGFVCGQTFSEDYPCLQYDIGPLQNTRPVEYCTGGENDLLLQVFNNYFAPAEADIIINIEVDRANALIELSDVESPILGYSSTI